MRVSDRFRLLKAVLFCCALACFTGLELGAFMLGGAAASGPEPDKWNRHIPTATLIAEKLGESLNYPKVAHYSTEFSKGIKFFYLFVFFAKELSDGRNVLAYTVINQHDGSVVNDINADGVNDFEGAEGIEISDSELAIDHESAFGILPIGSYIWLWYVWKKTDGSLAFRVRRFNIFLEDEGLTEEEGSIDDPDICAEIPPEFTYVTGLKNDFFLFTYMTCDGLSIKTAVLRVNQINLKVQKDIEPVEIISVGSMVALSSGKTPTSGALLNYGYISSITANEFGYESTLSGKTVDPLFLVTYELETTSALGVVNGSGSEEKETGLFAAAFIYSWSQKNSPAYIAPYSNWNPNNNNGPVQLAKGEVWNVACGTANKGGSNQLGTIVYGLNDENGNGKVYCLGLRDDGTIINLNGANLNISPGLASVHDFDMEIINYQATNKSYIIIHALLLTDNGSFLQMVHVDSANNLVLNGHQDPLPVVDIALKDPSEPRVITSESRGAASAFNGSVVMFKAGGFLYAQSFDDSNESKMMFEPSGEITAISGKEDSSSQIVLYFDDSGGPIGGGASSDSFWLISAYSGEGKIKGGSVDLETGFYGGSPSPTTIKSTVFNNQHKPFSVDLTFKHAEEYDRIEIERTEEGKPWEQVGAISGKETQFSDNLGTEEGGEYEYRAVAVVANGVEDEGGAEEVISDKSKTDEIELPDIYPPFISVTLQAFREVIPGEEYLRAVISIENFSSIAERMLIYKKANGLSPPPIKSPIKETYIDPNILFDSTYEYYVVFVDDEGNKSPPSNVVSIFTGSSFAPSQAFLPDEDTGLTGSKSRKWKEFIKKCYVATAVAGGQSNKTVNMLVSVRDYDLRLNTSGGLSVALYDRLSQYGAFITTSGKEPPMYNIIFIASLILLAVTLRKL